MLSLSSTWSNFFSCYSPEFVKKNKRKLKTMFFYSYDLQTIEIEKERSVSPKLTREIVYEKRRENT